MSPPLLLHPHQTVVVSPSGLADMGDSSDNRSTQVNSCSSTDLSRFSFEADGHSPGAAPGRREIPFDPGKQVQDIIVSTHVGPPVATTELSPRWIGMEKTTPRIRLTGLTRRNGAAQ